MNRSQIIRRIAQGWLLLLILGSLQPVRPAPFVGLHRGIHILAFAGAAFLLLLISRTRRQQIRGVIAMCLLGLFLESAQHLVYRHPMEWRDVRDDTLAVLAAFALYQSAGIRRAVFAATRCAAGTGRSS